MVYDFKITSIEKPEFLLRVQLDDQHTFADFHNCLQEACGYGADQLASFFIAGKNWGKQIEISQLDLGITGISENIMTKTRIRDIINSEKQRLLYVFDLINDRSFYIELIQIAMGKSVLEPTITYTNGEAPDQLLEDEIQKQGYEFLYEDDKYDYGDLDDYTEIFGEMEDLMEGL